MSRRAGRSAESESETLRRVREIAARAGVSLMTVRRVFNRPDQVAEATRDKVLAAAREVGYRPHSAAPALRLASPASFPPWCRNRTS